MTSPRPRRRPERAPVLLLLLLLTGCATVRQVPDVVDVAVVGGGLAGLVTAYELQQRGLDAHVLELSDRLGGRVATAEYGPGLQAEYGLEELWGKSPLVPLARALGVQLDGEGSFSSVVLDGKLHAFTQGTNEDFFDSLFDPEERAAQQRFFKHAEAIFGQLEQHPSLIELSFAQWLEQERLPSRVAKWVRLTLECELGASAEEFSALSGLAELRTFLFGGEQAFHVVGGNSRLIDAFEKSLAGHTTTRAKVLGVDRRRDAKGEWNVTVRYLRDGQVKELHARRVVVAVPWMMLHLIELDPPLPQSAQLALASIGRGQYAVVHLLIDKGAHQLWGGAESRPFPVLTEGLLGTIYGVRTLSPRSQPNEVFSLLIHGSAARAFHLVPHERKKDEVVAGLDALWPGFAKYVRGSAVYTYHPAAIPFWPPGRSPLDAQAQRLFDAFDGLYLAGDYLVSSHSEGAVIAAQRQARAIARDLSRPTAQSRAMVPNQPSTLPPEAPPMHITLTRKLVERRGDRWEVRVVAKFSNTGKKTFALDKLTAALDGELANDVFEITCPQGPVPYQGEMAKRAHPGPAGFARIAPGGSVETSIDLGAAYAFPPAGGRCSVRFRSANHFSVDDVELQSDELIIELPASAATGAKK